ncbi:MAG: GxxExxY protein [Bacteroidia bacterium]
MDKKELNRIGYSIVGAAMEVHKRLGPGLLESLYQKAMEIELKERNHTVASEVQIPVLYKDQIIANELRLDLLIDDAVIIELKAVNEVHPKMHAQLLTYLKLTDLRLGYLINFHEANLLDGIHRMVNRLDKAA